MTLEAEQLRDTILTGRLVSITPPTRRERASAPDTRAPAAPPPPAAVPSTAKPVQVDRSTVESALAEAVLSSPTYREQAERSGRHPLRADVVHATLATLLARHGRASRREIASATGLPEVLLDATLAAMRRLTNVEGYDVLFLDLDGVTVRLDERLLREQFAIS